jgi:hypothetical protein
LRIIQLQNKKENKKQGEIHKKHDEYLLKVCHDFDEQIQVDLEGHLDLEGEQNKEILVHLIMKD